MADLMEGLQEMESRRNERIKKYGPQIRDALRLTPHLERKSGYRYGGNAILNKPAFHSTAAVSWKFDVYNSASRVHGSLSITDCSENIALDLSFSSTAELINVTHKLKQLVLQVEMALAVAESFNLVAEVLESADD